MATAVLVPEPTVMSRLDRLDMLLGYLEEMRGAGRTVMRSSCASTTSSGTATTCDDSVGSSPKMIRRQSQCRPIDDAVAEVQLKGTLLDRVHNLESRLIKLEEEIGYEKRKEEEEIEHEKRTDEESSPRSGEKQQQHHHHHHGTGLKRLVKACVKVKTKE